MAMAAPTAAALPPHKLAAAAAVPLPFLFSRAPLLRSTRRLPLTPLVASSDAEAGIEWTESEDDEAGELDEPLQEGDQEEVVEEEEGEGVVVASGVEPPEEAMVYVGNLPYDVDSERLAQLFDQAGVVEVAEVIYNRETGQSRGFGFVTMSTIEEADKAIEMFNRYVNAFLSSHFFSSSLNYQDSSLKDISGRLLNVNRAAPSGSRMERPPRQFATAFRAYVGNLPWQVDDSRLMQLFNEHGEVVDATVIYDRETGRSQGFGFVSMASKEELDDAISALDGQQTWNFE